MIHIPQVVEKSCGADLTTNHLTTNHADYSPLRPFNGEV
jgi:hypothetical protein